MFSDMHQLKEIDGEIFLDRDGKTFETLVNYLRNDRKVDKSVFVPDIQNYTNIHNITRDDQNKTRIVNEDDDNLKKAKEF